MAQLTVEILSHSKIDSQQWDTFITASPQGGVYSLHGYATAVADQWEAAIVHQSGEWRAVMPFVTKQKLGLSYSLQPLFCQFWGVFFAPSATSFYKQVSEQRKCLELLMPVWERFRLITYRLSPALEDLLPWHWKGFALKPRITYILDVKKEENELWAEMASSLQRQIKKGKKYELQLSQSDDLSLLFSLIKRQQEQGHDVLAGTKNGVPILERLGTFLLQHNRAKLFYIHQKNSKNPLAIGLFAYFKGQCIYLIGAYDPSEKQLGAMSQLMWHAISDAQQHECQVFDFEGSMIPGVEGFFRKFGAKPQTYFEISKNTLPLPLRWMDK